MKPVTIKDIGSDTATVSLDLAGPRDARSLVRLMPSFEHGGEEEGLLYRAADARALGEALIRAADVAEAHQRDATA